MPVDFNTLKQKLNALNEQTAPKQNGTGKKLFWSPNQTHVVRLVPYPYDLSDPFRELYFYYIFSRVSGQKPAPITSPLSYGLPDPIFEFAKSLQVRGGSTSDYKMGKRLEPPRRPHALVLVRGEESEGFKYWGFSDSVYKELLNIMLDPDYGDITDVHHGRDITVTFTPAQSEGAYAKTSIRVKPNITPLTDDPAVLEALKNIPRVEDVFIPPSYDELKTILEEYLRTADTVSPSASNPTAANTSAAPAVPTHSTTSEPPHSGTLTSSSSANTFTPSSAADAFEELFKQGFPRM